jgi:hypothetical protein
VLVEVGAFLGFGLTPLMLSAVPLPAAVAVACRAVAQDSSCEGGTRTGRMLSCVFMRISSTAKTSLGFSIATVRLLPSMRIGTAP